MGRRPRSKRLFLEGSSYQPHDDKHAVDVCRCGSGKQVLVLEKFVPNVASRSPTLMLLFSMLRTFMQMINQQIVHFNNRGFG